MEINTATHFSRLFQTFKPVMPFLPLIQKLIPELRLWTYANNMSALAFTTHTLEKLENLLKTAGYRVRYEKGNFKTGACLLLNSRIVVINKFSNLESKIQSIIELLSELEIDHKLIDDKQLAILHQIKQTKLQL